MILTKSPAARTALIYVTVGALTIIWSGVWLAYLLSNPPESNGIFYICTGFIITGVAMLLLGLGLGRLGRAARDAEAPVQVIIPKTEPVAAVVAPASPAPVAGTIIVPENNGQPMNNVSSGAALASQEGPVKILR